MVAGDRVLYGYSYPPLLLLLALPGQILAGDLRYSHLLALTIAGALIACARPGPHRFSGGDAAPVRAAYLFRAGAELDGLFRCHDSGAAGFLRLSLGTRLPGRCSDFPRSQTSTSCSPCRCSGSCDRSSCALRVQGHPRHCRGDGSLLDVTARLVGFPAFWRDLIVIQFQLPFRMDSLSFSAALAHLTGVKLPSLVGFLAAGAATVVALRRCPVSPAGFSLGVSWVYFAFLRHQPSGFCDYYFFILGALCISLGAWRSAST